MNFRTVILAAAGMALVAHGQVAPAPANPAYPLAMKTRWTYAMRQEFGPGVHPSPANAALVKGNVLTATVVSEVAGSDLIGTVRYTRVESRVNGRLWMTEWMRLTPAGLFLGKTNEDGEDTLFSPPQKIISRGMAAGEAWEWKASGEPVQIRTRVTGKEGVEVPAGKFDAFKTVHELTMVMPEVTVHSTNARWFAPGVGYVRQETEAHAGEHLLTRTELRLTAFEAGK